MDHVLQIEPVTVQRWQAVFLAGLEERIAVEFAIAGDAGTGHAGVDLGKHVGQRGRRGHRPATDVKRRQLAAQRSAYSRRSGVSRAFSMPRSQEQSNLRSGPSQRSSHDCCNGIGVSIA